MIWSGKHALKYVIEPPRVKVNPNGIDVGVCLIRRIDDKAIARIHGETRELNILKRQIHLGPDGFYHLEKGTYEVRIANQVNVPKNAVVFAYPRSTFNRLGVIKSQTAVWDSGYSGYGTQTIYVPIEIDIHKDEMWFQLVFMDCEPSSLYKGHWQGR